MSYKVTDRPLVPGDLPDPGINPGSPVLQVDSLPVELPVKPHFNLNYLLKVLSPNIVTKVLGLQHDTL